MAIEKGLYKTPKGIDELAEGNIEAIDIEIELPEGEMLSDIIEMEDGSVEVNLGGPMAEGDVNGAPFDANLAEYLSEDELSELSQDLMEQVKTDTDSRKEWAEIYVKGLEIVGFKQEDRTSPWKDACGVHSTVLAEAAIRFQAEAMSETFPAAGPVKAKIMGETTRELEEAAERVRVDMNYELTEEMTEYRPEHERMLYSLGLAGSALKKVYFDPTIGRQVAIYIPAEDVIVPFGASSVEQAERVTHVMRKTQNEMAKLQAAGFYRDVELEEPVAFRSDIEDKKSELDGYSAIDDDRYAVYEIHADIIIPGVDGAVNDDDVDGLQVANPYVVTIEQGTDTVLAIRRNWMPDDGLRLKRQHFVHYVYVPGYGFYGLGLIHIIGGYAKAGTSLIRQLVDAGTLSNLPGGLKARGMNIKGDDDPIGPGEWRDVDVPSGSIRDSLLPLPYGEPSATLLALLNQITEEGRRLGAISDMNISDMSANAPVGTTLALLERTLKPMAAVQSRVHYSMKQEFKLLKAIIGEHAPDEYGYVPYRAEPRARRDDYNLIEVIPVSDPNSSTMAQRVVQYQTVLQMASQSPQIYDLPQLHRQMIETIGIKNADKLVPTEEDIKPTDPISENMGSLVGTPMKAFIMQDHGAHMASHAAFMQDPMIMQAIGQNPMAQQIMGALQAHMLEHMGFQYRSQIEEQLGTQLPAPGQELPPGVEVQLSRLLADASKSLAQLHQQQAAQQQQQQEAADPINIQKDKEIAIKGGELERKMAKDAADKDTADKRLELEKAKALVAATNESARIDAQGDQADRKSDVDAAKAILDLAKAKITTDKKPASDETTKPDKPEEKRSK
jgi:hypothetical protein